MRFDHALSIDCDPPPPLRFLCDSGNDLFWIHEVAANTSQLSSMAPERHKTSLESLALLGSFAPKFVDQPMPSIGIRMDIVRNSARW